MLITKASSDEIIAAKESSIKELQDEIKDIESIKTQADNFVANLKNILA